MNTATIPEAISNYADVIDSRDVIARIEYLESELINEDGAIPVIDDFLHGDADRTEEIEELANLKALAEEASGYAADWPYGEALIRGSYFQDYARELADDCGMVPNDLSWPCNFINWDAASDALKQDYTCVSFGGVEYWIR